MYSPYLKKKKVRHQLQSDPTPGFSTKFRRGGKISTTVRGCPVLVLKFSTMPSSGGQSEGQARWTAYTRNALVNQKELATWRRDGHFSPWRP